MRGTKAKQARRIVVGAGADSVKAVEYKQAPWGQIFTLGARHYYQHVKRVLRGHRGTHRYTTTAGARLQSQRSLDS